MPVQKVVVINDASQARGGATGLALLSVRLLRERGVPVVYVCGDDGENDELARLGVEVHALGGERLLSQSAARAFRRGLYNDATEGLIAQVLRKHDSAGTVYHLHGWAQVFSPAVFEALRPVARRTWVHAHDMFLACPNGVYMDYRHDTVCQRVPLSFACVTRNCDKRSYPHKLWRLARQRNVQRLFARQEGWAGIVPILPAMIPRLSRAGYEPEMFHTVRNPARPFTDQRVCVEENTGFVYVGRLEADKGVARLAEAAVRCGAHVTFVGEGPLAETLVSQGFEVTGWLTREEIGQRIEGHRALVMPSLHPEPFALVLVEALGSGVPVLTAQSALMAEEICGLGVGYQFDVHDIDSMCSALTTFDELSDDALRGMSERAFDVWHQLAHTQQSWIDELMELYESVAR
ncbi:glycosyltransferase [Shimia abyssi]|uniref:Glycosyltransferase involved in cell wall biosynthesis n=1 Tax=Shimia abyssi TaxID=1662395 RepID=A0A2P8F9Q7_9RHOB|nr:glycosyltransferase [Shimia abyssi]PSL18461.1 glycosyltransferase involved in cell wall biosynthesis [Shimia abyssi]